MRFRGEIRLFGLIILAAIVSVATFFLGSAVPSGSFGGNFFGMTVKFGGSPALFVFMMYSYSKNGLLTFGDKAELIGQPDENMSKEEIHGQLDLMEVESKRLLRRKDELEKMLAAKEAGKSREEGYVAGWFTPVSRPVKPLVFEIGG